MGKKRMHRYNKDFSPDLNEYKLVKENSRGKVYKMPDGNILTIYTKEKRYKRELNNYKKLDGKDLFSKMLYSSNNYIISEDIMGMKLNKHIKSHGLSDELCEEILGVLFELKKLGMKRIDIKLKSVYILENKICKIQPFNNCFTKKQEIPISLMKGLDKLGLLEKFINTAEKKDKKLSKNWAINYEKWKEENKKKESKKKKGKARITQDYFNQQSTKQYVYKDKKAKDIYSIESSYSIFDEDEMEFVKFDSIKLKPFE